MIVHTIEQGTTEWLCLRAGIPTASEFDNIMTPLFKPRKGDMPESYLAMKLAERWLGGPIPSGSSWSMEQGKIREKDAIPAFELETSQDVQTVGFVTTDDGRIGCSPDGLIGEDSGIEVKCPDPHTHVGYLLDGQIPDKYRAQVYGSLYVTGRPEWNFYSYRPKFPPLLVKVTRDEAIMQAIEGILVNFLERFDEAFERLVAANGGERPPEKKIRGGDPAWMKD